MKPRRASLRPASRVEDSGSRAALESQPEEADPPSAEPKPSASPPLARVALLGNPNTGKTSLFNRLCGLRAHVANYPGITADARVGLAKVDSGETRIVDLPGIYSLDLDLPESKLCRQLLTGEWDPGTPDGDRPDCILVVVDASNLVRNLTLVGEALGTGLPIVIALTMVDIARKRGLVIDPSKLAAEIGVPVVAMNARLGEGIDDVLAALPRAALPQENTPVTTAISGDRARLEAWCGAVTDRVTTKISTPLDRTTDVLDRALTHPVLGVLAFLITMGGLFATIFWFAAAPMGWIETVFGALGGLLRDVLPTGVVRDLLVDGVVAGIAGTVIFLPQICLLFFLLTLLEDTGYLARAAFVANQLLRPFGLPGHAFVPLLSSHACAIPGIMCSRLIPDRRDRLATILVAPFLSCSARLPVYTLLIGILFVGQPLWAGAAFAGCYLLGGAAALLTALMFRRTILRGRSRPMLLELPPYRLPSLKNAMLTAIDRGKQFLVKAGTVILLISIVLWWLATYPTTPESARVADLRAQAALATATQPDTAEELSAQADHLAGRESLSGSFAGRIGRTIEPVFEPIGSDWQLSIAILSSFAAREVFVSSLLVTLGAGDDIEEAERVRDVVGAARRDDGSPLLDFPSAAALLVFFVLAMQCLPTLAVTRREAGGWHWAALQFSYMSLVAWVLAWITFQIATASMGV